MGERDQLKTEDSKDVPVDLPTQTGFVAASPEAPAAGDATLEPELQAFIGRQLKATYDEVLNEAVPDRFLELLKKLEGGGTDAS